MSSNLASFSRLPPAYYAPDAGSVQHVAPDSLAARVFYAALPFLALHRPLGKVITLVMDVTRVISNCGQEAKWLQTAMAVGILVSTIFAHPLGLCISTLQELVSALLEAHAALQVGQYQEVFTALFTSSQHLAYLGTILTGSVEILALSLLLSMAAEIVRSRKEFGKDRWIETASHLLMSVVRGAQALPQLSRIADQRRLPGREFVNSLTTTAAKMRDRAALFFYSSARFLVKPLWASTDVWLRTISFCNDPQSSTMQKVRSFAKSTLASCALLPLTLSGLVLGQVFHFTAFNLSTTPYIHLQGGFEAQKSADQGGSVFQGNACLTAGGFAQLFGGVSLPDEERAQKVAALIREGKFDLACLQEVSDLETALTLYRELFPHFAEFYLNIGATPLILQNNSGLFVASKWEISRPEVHSFSDIPGTESMVNKCYFLFSTAMGHFITTHLSPSSDDLNPTDVEIGVRAEEQRRIFAAGQQRFSEESRPVYVLGDFNIVQGGDEYRNSPFLRGGALMGQEAACETGYLVQRNWLGNIAARTQGLVLDYFRAIFGDRLASTRVAYAMDVARPEEALSDHPFLVSTVS